MAIERVSTRVTEGGHNIPEEVIKRRYVAGINNLFNIYLPIVNEAIVFDSSNGLPELIAEKTIDTEINIVIGIKFESFKALL